MVLLWVSTTHGGQEAEPRPCCPTHFSSMTTGPQTAYIRHLVVEPVDPTRPWVPDGATQQDLYGGDGQHGAY